MVFGPYTWFLDHTHGVDSDSIWPGFTPPSLTHVTLQKWGGWLSIAGDLVSGGGLQTLLPLGENPYIFNTIENKIGLFQMHLFNDRPSSENKNKKSFASRTLKFGMSNLQKCRNVP